MARGAILLLSIAALLTAAIPSRAAARVAMAQDLPALCVDAARAAASRHGIPAEVMLAITLVETRRTVDGVSGPWPWTLNIDGKGYWYESRSAALAHAERALARGRRSIDLGCFQLNYHWHGAHFSSADQMLEPGRAAEYAAGFLNDLYAETGDWLRAAGYYHSRTPVHSRRYRGLVGRALAHLGAADVLSAAAPAEAPRPGPRAGGPAHAIVLADARRASDPVRAAAPGAVMLRMFSTRARPLFAAPGLRP